MKRYKLEESEKEDRVLVGVGSPKARTQPGGQLQIRELPRVLNLEKESSEHPKQTHLEEMQHSLIYPARSHFQRTLSRERWGQG